MRPTKADSANKFLINLGPGLSVSTPPTQTRVSNRVEKVHFALVGSKHEIGRVRIVWITLCSSASSDNSTVDHGEVAFILDLQ